MKTKLSSGLFNQYSCSFPFSQQFLSSETLFSCLYYPWTLNRSTFWSLHRTTIWSLWKGPNFGPYIQVHILDLHEGPKSGPRIEGPHSAGGSTQVHEGPHRDHGHVLHKVHYKYIKSRFQTAIEVKTIIIGHFFYSNQILCVGW